MNHRFYSHTANPLHRVFSGVIKTNERGVGLIEVMIALFILAFGALAIGNMQASALSAVFISTSHYQVSSISEEILEHLKADATQAGLGAYNTTFAKTTADATVPTQRAKVINSWKNRVADVLPSGAAEIDCTITECSVSLRWRESVSVGVSQQFYRLKIPL